MDKPYMGKILMVDLSTRSLMEETIPDRVYELYLSGMGLGAYILYDRMPAGADPLGPENPLIISGGLLTATCASATARTHIMAKSPLTNLLGSCNMGGFFAP